MDKTAVLDASKLPWRSNETTVDWSDIGGAKLQQNQIIRYFLSNKDANVFEDDEVTVSVNEKTQFLALFAQGKISDGDEAELLQEIRDPLNNPNIGLTKLYWAIMGDPRARQIIAVIAGYNERNWQEFDESDLKKFLTEVRSNGADFRTPIGFMPAKQQFLDGIRPHANDEIFSAYERSMKSLEALLYGKRLEYYQQFETLRQEAKGERLVKAPTISSENVVKNTTKLVAEKSEPKISASTLEYQKIDTERADAMLARTLIEGDGWHQNNHEYRLNAHHLMRAGLRPLYEVKIEGKEWYFSEPFYLTSGRVAIMGYINSRDGIKVRSFYRSQPQGLWRYVPDYIRDINKSSGIGALGQGYDEASLILPVELQQLLMQITRESEVRRITVTNPNFFLAGPMKVYNSLTDYREARNNNHMIGDYYNEVSSEPMSHEFRVSPSGRRDAPQTLGISKTKSPDFTKKVAEFITASNLVGKIKIEAFLSHDGQLKWVFCQDAKKRVWISHVEVVSALTSVGVRRNWMTIGELATPLYEYSRKTGGYGDPFDTKGPYQCMWKNYLSKIPLIQNYLKYQNKD